MDQPQPDKIPLVDGAATSTKIPNFGLIPRPALVSYAGRLEEGLVRHKDKAWNAQSSNFQKVNGDKEWVLLRLSHVIDHALQAIAEITGQVAPSGEDHAGAVMFGGGVLACSYWNPYKSESEQLYPQKPNEVPGVDRTLNYDTSMGGGCDECGNTHGDNHSLNCTIGGTRTRVNDQR